MLYSYPSILWIASSMMLLTYLELIFDLASYTTISKEEGLIEEIHYYSSSDYTDSDTVLFINNDSIPVYFKERKILDYRTDNLLKETSYDQSGQASDSTIIEFNSNHSVLYRISRSSTSTYTSNYEYDEKSRLKSVKSRASYKKSPNYESPQTEMALIYYDNTDIIKSITAKSMSVESELKEDTVFYYMKENPIATDTASVLTKLLPIFDGKIYLLTDSLNYYLISEYESSSFFNPFEKDIYVYDKEWNIVSKRVVQNGKTIELKGSSFDSNNRIITVKEYDRDDGSSITSVEYFHYGNISLPTLEYKVDHYLDGKEIIIRRSIE